ncbi:DMT family transporter [Rhodobacteraceae bacterium 2376]|uniref:DMT family transporter n=1 Tax=Rhabdonatronobacter sediminivivens TaxID=2743469 RepID=A0A7Z0KY13_9RHOB|nr:DMT family transporter [Rhabdonatronobacter sediminivivens]NYS24904.1 DMT family transporter [Rhabdonatronobacter sediminivivens]
MHQEEAQPVKAALWMMGAIASFTLMAVAGRAIQVELSSFELMFWRSLVGFAIVLVLVMGLSRAGLRQLVPSAPGLHLARNVFHFAGQNLWFFGITVIPLAQLVALEFTSPIWVALLAPLLLGEALTRRKLAVAVLGFGGVLLVAQPGVQPLNAGHLAGMLAALCFALNVIFTKRIMRYDSVWCVLFWMTLSQTLFGLVLSFIGGFTWPSVALIPWLLVVGVTGLTAHFSLTSALGLAPASTVAPMEFARLPVIALVGVWLYAEGLDPLVFLGAAIIFSANWWNMRAGRPRPVGKEI